MVFGFFLSNRVLSFSFIKSNETRLKPTYSSVLKTIIKHEQHIKVKKVPKIGKSSFSSMTPKIIVGISNRQEANKNFKYFGFCGQFLLNRIRFNSVVSPYTSVKPTSNA